jgi:hypothetical protein
MIRSTVHDLPSIDGYDQVMISRFTTLEVGSPLFSRSPISDICKRQINGPDFSFDQ